MKSSESRLAFEAAKLWLWPRVCHSAKSFRENKELEDFPLLIQLLAKNIFTELISSLKFSIRSFKNSDPKGHTGQ